VKVLRWNNSIDDPQLLEQENPLPQPGQDELLVRVYAAGITPSELFWYPTSHTRNGESRNHPVPVHEFSGVIAAVGQNANGFAEGDEVFGMNDWFDEGALAEYCVTHSAWVAPKPASLTHEEAASVPIGALTAWQGLYDHAQLKTGDRVLVNGAAGSVGVYVVQLAKLRSAHVIATASARNLDFVKELGAEEVLDYAKARFEDTVRDMDVVFDAIGGETLRRSWSVLKPTGRMVTVAADVENSKDDREKKAFFIVQPNQAQLRKIGELLESKTLRVIVDAVLPFEQASAAYAGKVHDRQRRGKMVVTVRAQHGTAATSC
jgi:NADPH:quinone reductase-like Zn-dependent oxidoreductase